MKRKRIITIVILCVLCLPFLVDAKEYCKVVYGNGKDVGSEIACGMEHFYIVNSTNEEIKMLAKYNLYVGVIIYKEKIEKEEGDARTDAEYCNDLAASKNGVVRSDNFYNAPGYCFIQISLPNDKVEQNEMAVSAHWQGDSYEYPQVGDVYISGDSGGMYTPVGGPYTDFSIDLDSATKYNNYFYDLTIANGPVSLLLQQYKDELATKGYEVKDVNMLTLDDINTIVKKADKSIPYADWYNHTREIVPPHFEFGSLKDFISQKEEFLYGTTYWIRTGYDRSANSGNMIGTDNIVFVNTNGGVCGSGIITGTYYNNNCQTFLHLQTSLGAGLRPLVSISPNELQYLIQTDSNGGGNIEVVETSLGGEKIQFKISTNRGYKLGSIIVKTDSGEEVEFSEDEITVGEGEIISISTNKFTMPFENITIQARFKPENIITNPKTGASVLIIIVVLLSLGLGLKVYHNKRA